VAAALPEEPAKGHCWNCWNRLAIGKDKFAICWNPACLYILVKSVATKRANLSWLIDRITDQEDYSQHIALQLLEKGEYRITPGRVATWTQDYLKLQGRSVKESPEVVVDLEIMELMDNETQWYVGHMSGNPFKTLFLKQMCYWVETTWGAMWLLYLVGRLYWTDVAKMLRCGFAEFREKVRDLRVEARVFGHGMRLERAERWR